MINSLSRSKAFALGAASVLNISGASTQPVYLSRSVQEGLRGHFERVGGFIWYAIEQQPELPEADDAPQQLEFAALNT
jgi:hypothetical protein